jgi:hypothetical protein
MKRYLITGIPGTGKTEVGNFLKNIHHFKHVDFEDSVSLNRFVADPVDFIKSELQGCDIVISWGFVPVDGQINIVKYLQSIGFKLIWFDGNREAARRAFIKRGTVSVDLLDIQIKRINDSQVISIINPIIINTFDENGEFKPLESIVGEIEESKESFMNS